MEVSRKILSEKRHFCQTNTQVAGIPKLTKLNQANQTPAGETEAAAAISFSLANLGRTATIPSRIAL
jgi:hypothetical protein